MEDLPCPAASSILPACSAAAVGGQDQRVLLGFGSATELLYDGMRAYAARPTTQEASGRSCLWWQRGELGWKMNTQLPGAWVPGLPPPSRVCVSARPVPVTKCVFP